MTAEGKLTDKEFDEFIGKEKGMTWAEWVSFAQDILRRHAKRNPDYAAQQRRHAAAMKLLEYVEWLGVNGVDIRQNVSGKWTIGDHWNHDIQSRANDLLTTIEQLPTKDTQHDNQQHRSNDSDGEQGAHNRDSATGT